MPSQLLGRQDVHRALETSRGIQESGRNARILRTTGASPDHPTHPQLPESAYLKAMLYHLD